MHPPSDVTALLKAWRGGDQTALERLTPLVYNHLRRLGRQYVRKERTDNRAAKQLAEWFDVVLIDYDLDDGKGDALVSQLRTADPRPRIIGVSARPDGNSALLAAGADTVCEKGDFRRIRSVLGRAE